MLTFLSCRAFATVRFSDSPIRSLAATVRDPEAVKVQSDHQGCLQRVKHFKMAFKLEPGSAEVCAVINDSCSCGPEFYLSLPVSCDTGP